MSIDQWSTTAGNNASGVTGVNWAEGQAPSTVNDSARALMADVAGWYGQLKQNLALTGVAGTNTITAGCAAQVASLAANQIFTIIPAATNTGATTLNITPSGGAALTAKNVFSNGAACVGGELRISVPTMLMYDGTQFNIIGHVPDLQGTWTPTVGGTSTYTTQVGRYTRVGRLVFVYLEMTINAIGTGSTTTISGLPFTASASASQYALSLAFFNWSASFVSLQPVIPGGTSTIQMQGLTAAAANNSGTQVVYVSGAHVIMSGCYEV